MAHSFTRQQLYELVWVKPMWKLAKEMGISDVCLAKACRRTDIPTPGLGYWAKLKHGKKVRRTLFRLQRLRRLRLCRSAPERRFNHRS